VTLKRDGPHDRIDGRNDACEFKRARDLEPQAAYAQFAIFFSDRLPTTIR
jgi:hypothetical protein